MLRGYDMAYESKFLRALQILGNIFFPFILLGILAVEILDWLAFKLSKDEDTR